jgi:hypothetical protein
MKGPENFGSQEAKPGHEVLAAEASEKALAVLAERGLVTDPDQATLQDLDTLFTELPLLMHELSYNADGTVNNDNRYLVRELSVYLNKVALTRHAKMAPSPAFNQTT